MGNPKVLLVGDFLLDSYVYGDAVRISPEAPVAVLKVVERGYACGGSGSTTASLLFSSGGGVVDVASEASMTGVGTATVFSVVLTGSGFPLTYQMLAITTAMPTSPTAIATRPIVGERSSSPDTSAAARLIRRFVMTRDS